MLKRIIGTNSKNLSKFVNYSKVSMTTNIVKPLSVLDIDKEKKDKTLIEKINYNEGVKEYLTNVYKKTGTGFATSLVVGSVAPIVVVGAGITSIAPVLWIANIPLSFYSLYKMNKLKTDVNEVNGKFIEKDNNEKNKWYNVFSIANGITLSPVMYISYFISPLIIPISLASVGGVFTASTLYAMKQKDYSLIKYQGPLIGGVCGLITSGLLQLGLMGFGYYDASVTLGLATSVISTAIFTGLIAVDTQIAIKSYEEKQLDSVNMAVTLLLDATNLFLDIMKILGEIFKNIKSN